MIPHSPTYIPSHEIQINIGNHLTSPTASLTPSPTPISPHPILYQYTIRREYL